MTDPAVVKNEEENLIGSNPRDLALLKIMELQKDPASSKIQHLFSIYLQAFRKLAGNFFGLDPDLIKKNFDQETIRGLEELIICKAKKRSFATQVFMYSVPLVGWMCLLPIKYPIVQEMTLHMSYRFLRSRRKLKKIGVDPMSLLIKGWSIRDKKQ